MRAAAGTHHVRQIIQTQNYYAHAIVSHKLPAMKCEREIDVHCQEADKDPCRGAPV